MVGVCKNEGTSAKEDALTTRSAARVFERIFMCVLVEK